MRATRCGWSWIGIVAAWLAPVVVAGCAAGGDVAGSEAIAPVGREERPGHAREIARLAVWNAAPDLRRPTESELSASALALTSGSIASGSGVTSGGVRTLVLYDSTGQYGWLGELYGVAASNLASHFGAWSAEPVTAYTCGQIESFGAVVYMGATYDEPLPPCLLDDVLATRRPVVWTYFNAWQLVARAGRDSFVSRYGFDASLLDFSRFSSVRYHGRTLTRFADNVGMLALAITDRTRAQELATAVREDGTTSPWAVRSGNLTMIAEIPFSYMSEEDRVLAFEDLLFDVLAPTTPTRHVALVRIEDIDPSTDPAALRAIADYLWSVQVPFGFGVVAEYRDPLGWYNGGTPETIRLRDASALTAALRYMQSHGGVLVEHGYTHQWDGAPNPYDEVTGDDTEFFRVTENPDHSFVFAGPLPGDSVSWASGRMRSAERALQNAGLTAPRIFEFPHYTASAPDYAAAASRYPTRWERSLYFSGQLRGGTIDHSRWLGQLFPYVVRDVYGARVLPENLGNIDLETWYGRPPHLPADVVRAADRNLVVRNGVVGFYFHPFLPLDYLRQTVEGVRGLGYTFVSPSSL